MSRPLLVIGNKNYSSWSLRAWVVLRKAGVDFDELRLPLDTPQFRKGIADHSPTGMVPVLRDGAIRVWDSLAIAEYVNERWASGKLWPGQPHLRAHARAVSAEMHSGFARLRQRMPMNCRARGRKVPVDADLAGEIGRVLEIWEDCRAASMNEAQQMPQETSQPMPQQASQDAARPLPRSTPQQASQKTQQVSLWLYGDFSIADAMYIPVALRFNTYGVELPDVARDYLGAVLADADIAEWMAAAEREEEVNPAGEAGQ